MTTVIVADNREMDRQGLVSLLKEQPENFVISSTSSASDTHKKIIQLRPDIAILSNSIQYGAVLQDIIGDYYDPSGCKFIWLTTHESPDDSKIAISLGIPAILSKENRFEDLISAITIVLHGGEFKPPSLRKKLNSHNSPSDLSQLSNREREVLAEISKGLTAKEIARNLSLSPRTIETYKVRIMQKLEIRGLANLIRYAIEKGA
ncbi:response regulator transcription factor [Halomonas cupida]|uniref:response regulator transcription factor n=1 Tax=Halomonas cupida TaxID=44933 RepID=UPI0039B4D700